MTDGRDPLRIYLKDHAAGAGGGASLIARLAEGSEDERERATLRKIEDEIEQERPVLSGLLDRLHSHPSRLKLAGAKLGEGLSRPKLRSNSPEGRVLQYEAMIMGVTGKLELWRSLAVLARSGDEILDPRSIETLEGQAERQRADLEHLHGEVAGRAFAA
jgi:hypothetical protein